MPSHALHCPLPTSGHHARRSPFVPRLCSVLALALATVPIHSAAAASPSATEDAPATSAKAQADALSDEAVARFSAEDFDGAIELFEQAYALDAQANYLFNIGRVYEERGDLAAAVDCYQRFVGSKGVDLEARQNATARLKVLRQALEALQPETQPEQAAETETETETLGPVDDTNDDDDDDDAQANRKRSLRIAGYTLLGVGGGALIVGGIFGGLALGKSNSAEDQRFVDDAVRLRDEARVRARVADAMFIAGGVFAATGLAIVLSTVGEKKRGDTASARKTTTARWSPWATPRSAGISLAGQF
ncbi:MAG: tetratricopeptide repeat protein [Nannocystaceae bacterium]|nr:tetratricopeptide repeat protein [Nannocystaceae bacterium]